MSKNMFSVLDSDSEDEKVQSKVVSKQTNQDSQHKHAKNQFKQKVKTSDFKDGDVVRGKDSRGRGRGRGRGDRGRGDRGDRGGRGRGRGGFGGEGYNTEERGGRGRGRGGRGRGRGERGRGRGRFDRGRGRGGYRGRQDPEEAYSKLATKEQVLSKEELEASQAEGAEEHATEEFGKHGGYDKRSGTGYGREVKKGGAGKAGWGADETEQLEHRGAEAAAEIAEGEQPTQEEGKEGEGEGEKEEPDNTVSYQEYLEKRRQENANLTKTEARAPEEIKLKNIQKHEAKKATKGASSAIKAHESYAPTGIKSEVDLGFGTAPEEPEEIAYEERPRGGRGRGRGGRGRGRGGFNDRGRGAQGPKRGRGGKFVAKDDDFPSL